MTKEGAWGRIGGSRGKLCGSDTVRVRGFVDLGQMTNSSLKRGMKRPGLSEEIHCGDGRLLWKRPARPDWGESISKHGVFKLWPNCPQTKLAGLI